MTTNYVTIAIAKFHTNKSKILQILKLAICQLICNIYNWKYFVIPWWIEYWHNIFYEEKKRKLRIAVYNLQCAVCYCNDHIKTEL
jgi:hypothetical protein